MNKQERLELKEYSEIANNRLDNSNKNKEVKQEAMQSQARHSSQA